MGLLKSFHSSWEGLRERTSQGSGGWSQPLEGVYPPFGPKRGVWPDPPFWPKRGVPPPFIKDIFSSKKGQNRIAGNAHRSKKGLFSGFRGGVKKTPLPDPQKWPFWPSGGGTPSGGGIPPYSGGIPPFGASGPLSGVRDLWSELDRSYLPRQEGRA